MKVFELLDRLPMQIFELHDERTGKVNFYNIDEARRIMMEIYHRGHNYYRERFMIVDTTELYQQVLDGKYEVNWPYAMQTDLRMPIILVHEDDADWCIDGWHRIAKAGKLGVTDMACLRLTEEERQTCLISAEAGQAFLDMQAEFMKKITAGEQATVADFNRLREVLEKVKVKAQ